MTPDTTPRIAVRPAHRALVLGLLLGLSGIVAASVGMAQAPDRARHEAAKAAAPAPAEATP